MIDKNLKINVTCEQVYYDDNQKKIDEDNMSKDEYLVGYVNSLINIVLDNYCTRDQNNNAHYFNIINDKQLIISYETNVYGKQPRYQIELISNYRPCGNGGYSYTCLYRYYCGEIYKFTSAATPKNVMNYENNYVRLMDMLIFVSDNKIFDNQEINDQIEWIKAFIKYEVSEELIKSEL